MATPGTESSEGSSSRSSPFGSPVGIAAGVIGSAESGPAFVPITVDSVQDFRLRFGDISPHRFGSVAVESWLSYASACTYMRVLGIGDGKQRVSNEGTNSDGDNLPAGGVKDAGFVVGSRLTQSVAAPPSGLLVNNPMATAGGLPGRTYFLGAFMSESQGSRIFSDAGIQNALVAKVKATGTVTLNNTSIGNFFNTVIRLTDNAAVEKRYILRDLPTGDTGTTVDLDPGTGVVAHTVVGVQGLTYATAVAQLISAINGSTGHDGTIQASAGSTGILNVEQSYPGVNGNRLIITQNQYTDAGAQDWATYGIGSSAGFSGGYISNHAVPIIRGILFAASGVIPALSGSYTGNASTASIGPTSGIFGEKQDGGAAVGSCIADASAQEFVLLLNGHINTPEYPNTITASFNPIRTNEDGVSIYISSSLNTDPLKLQDAGHYLYTHYDIRTSQALVTGSGIVTAGKEKPLPDERTLIEAIYLTTASIPRNATDSYGSLGIPNFENFNDRFSTAKSPFIISQEFNRHPYNLFRFHSLHDGTGASEKIKISILNLILPTDEGEYAKFDVIIRAYDNSDDLVTPILANEEFLACNLNPSSENYIARMIGDQHSYFDFDRTEDRQRYVVDGNFPNYSAHVRIEINPDIERGNVPLNALPAGFRGPNHLVTSGSNIMSSPQQPLSDGSVLAASTNWAHKIAESPIPYREQIGDRPEGASSFSSELDLNPNLFWGLKTTQVEEMIRPNVSLAMNSGLKSYLKYFPTFTTSRTAVSVGSNTGTADSSGTVYDADRFNNNIFSLEKIQVHIVADTDIVDNSEWAYAKYRRDGVLREMVDSSGIKRSVLPGVFGADRFFDFSKDLSKTAPNVFAKFTVPMQGGFDGANIFSHDKSHFLNNAAYFELNDPLQGTVKGPTIVAYMKALKLIAMKSEVDIKLLAVPGIRLESIAAFAIGQVEEMFDAFYVMDVEQRDQLNTPVTSSAQVVSATHTAANFRSRGLDSSFAATYWPDVSMIDSISGNPVFVPPSVHLFKILSKADSAGSTFPVAGTGRATIESTGATTKVEFESIQKETIDTLYNAGINPIVTNPVAGPYVYSQRTFMIQRDTIFERINIRRMLIEIRRKIKVISEGFLFTQNREETLAAFEEACIPVMQRFVRGKGIERFLVKIDTTTTTQADIESNTVRGQIFLQPYKSEEFASIDFST